MKPHSWQDCRPALMTSGPGLPGQDSAAQAAVDQVWATLADPEKQAFHAFCCLGDKDVETLAVVAKISSLVEATMRVN